MSDYNLGVQGVAQLLPLFRELNDLKRIRVADRQGSIAERLFRRSWKRLVHSENIETVALQETAHAVAAARLAGIDARVLERGGFSPEERLEVLQRGFDVVADAIEPQLRHRLRQSLDAQAPEDNFEDNFDDLPSFVSSLQKQPRAGATRPGFARVVLEPTENHAEHCAIVAVNNVLATGLFGADVGEVFLTGLTHHLHNARLPDAGDAGDVLLGDKLKPLMERFRAEAIGELPSALQDPVRRALDNVFRSDTPASQSFQTGDVMDRVLEMDWHARSAAFTLDVALHDMDIVHPGPVQAFQQEIMRATQLMS